MKVNGMPELNKGQPGKGLQEKMRIREDSKLAQIGIIDRYYPKSPPGIVRCFQFLVAACAMLAVQSTGTCWYSFHTRFRFIAFVTIASFLLPFIIYLLYLYRVSNWLAKFMNMSITLLVTDATVSFLLFLASVLSFTADCVNSRYNAAIKITGVFGLMAILGFISTAYMEYCWYQALKQETTEEPTNPESAEA